MGYKLGNSIYKDFTTHNPVTSAITDADLTPTYEVFEDGTDIAIMSGSSVKRTSKTGNYRVQLDLTTGNGFEIGKSYNVIVTATVNAIIGKHVLSSFLLEEAGSGINQVTITVQETDLTPIPDVAITLLNNAETVILQNSITNINGQFITALDDGTYKIRLRKSNFVFTVPETLIVSGTTVDIYTGTGFTVSTPPTPDVITVWGNVYDLGMGGKNNLAVKATITKIPTTLNDVIISDDEETTITDTNGYFELYLALGAIIRLEIGTLFSKIIELPISGTDVNVATLLE